MNNTCKILLPLLLPFSCPNVLAAAQLRRSRKRL